ncbi:MAG: radical SAM protein [Candidatus Omnitrophota bacterium]
MKVTFIFPGITDCGFNAKHGNEATFINHGLCLLSACLKKREHAVELIDLRRLEGWEHFEKMIQEKDLGVVGITMMSCDYDPAMKAAEIIKKHKPGTPIVVGGPHPSIASEELKDDNRVDYIHLGEGEVTFPQLVEDLGAGKPRERIVSGIQANLDQLPFADRDLFGGSEEAFVPYLEEPFVTTIAGRGCLYNCNYCQPAERMIFGKGVRRRSVGHVIRELHELQEKYRFNSMMIHDDCLTEDPEWVTEFCHAYRQAPLGKPFVAQSRADLICKNEPMIKEMKRVGLALFIIGFESGSDRMLKFLRKGSTREQNLRAAEICHKYKIKIWANYMLGLPTETKEEQFETLDMLKKIKPYHSSPAYYTPHPGSDLFQYGLTNGLHILKGHGAYRRNSYEPKIGGIDYVFLEKILRESVALAEDQKDIKGNVRRFIPISFRQRLRPFLRPIKVLFEKYAPKNP